MSGLNLAAKEAYFQEQDLLDLSDDESYEIGESSKAIERALEDLEKTRPPSLLRNTSSFLGPTPKELQAEFGAHAKVRRASARQSAQNLKRSLTETDPTFSASGLKVWRNNELAHEASSNPNNRLKRGLSLPEALDKTQVPFYQRMGDVPRELKHGRNTKLAKKINLMAEDKQLLKNKIIYFYPNNDTSMAQRMRIHKTIELGAAWVKTWRNDITHVIIDDETHTYTQLLKHLGMDSLPDNIVLIKYQPYIPQCMQLGKLLDPTSHRFTVKDGPPRKQSTEVVKTSQVSAPPLTLPKVKPSRRQVPAQLSQNTDSIADTEVVSEQPADKQTAPITDDRVEDSFTMPHPMPVDVETGDEFRDDLSLAIQEAKALSHLPLDEDEDGETPAMGFADNTDAAGTDDDLPEAAPGQHRQFNFVSKASALRNKGALNVNHFQCMDPGANKYTSRNPNARTIQVLEEMCKYYDQIQDHWRTLAYRKGINTLKKQSVKISTAKQAAALPFIGQRLAEKIEEIVLTDRLRKLDNTRADPLATVLRLFLGVYGAGLVHANKWIQAGHRSLADLLAKATLTKSQKIGIQHYADFNTRIPRAEVEAHGAYVEAALRTLEPTYQATIMGSYRRGANDSGDIDMIISCPGTSISALRNLVFDTLVPHLFASGFLKAALATSHSGASAGSKWHGASCLPRSTTWRRIDLLVVPEQEMGAALLYFTGNDIFNRSIRLLARKKHMRLNQRGLYKDVHRDRRGTKVNEGVLVEGRSEKRIFEILGVPWREPHERIC